MLNHPFSDYQFNHSGSPTRSSKKHLNYTRKSHYPQHHPLMIQMASVTHTYIPWPFQTWFLNHLHTCTHTNKIHPSYVIQVTLRIVTFSHLYSSFHTFHLTSLVLTDSFVLVTASKSNLSFFKYIHHLSPFLLAIYFSNIWCTQTIHTILQILILRPQPGLRYIITILEKK